MASATAPAARPAVHGAVASLSGLGPSWASVGACFWTCSLPASECRFYRRLAAHRIRHGSRQHRAPVCPESLSDDFGGAALVAGRFQARRHCLEATLPQSRGALERDRGKHPGRPQTICVSHSARNAAGVRRWARRHRCRSEAVRTGDSSFRSAARRKVSCRTPPAFGRAANADL